MNAFGSSISDSARAHKSLHSAGHSGLVVTCLTAVHEILGLNSTMVSVCVCHQKKHCNIQPLAWAAQLTTVPISTHPFVNSKIRLSAIWLKNTTSGLRAQVAWHGLKAGSHLSLFYIRHIDWANSHKYKDLRNGDSTMNIILSTSIIIILCQSAQPDNA